MRRLALLILIALTAGIASAAGVFDLQQRKASYWCWTAIHAQTPPEVKRAAWVKSPIDQFVLAKLEQKELAPVGNADRRTLIRRACFDLTGLPPSAKDVEAFVNDSSPDAFSHVVDRLLASDHFGERWARHWMDVVRYGETRGHEFDPLIPNAWQYRDYLIRAFNADVPYNQFVTEQIAGDLLTQPRLNPKEGFNESILGTGYWFLGEEVHSPVDIRQDEADRLNNRIDTMTKAFLGLTVGCARCHDHKFDAISQKDFYALTGFVLSAGYRQVPFKSMGKNREVAGELDALRASAGPKMVVDLLAAERNGLSHSAEYLVACRQILATGADSPANITQLAGAKSLDAVALRNWLNELAIAGKDANHLLHPFALIAYDASSDRPEIFQRDYRQAIAPLHAVPDVKPASAIDQVLLDFDGQPPVNAWYSDGVAFGLHPIRAGEILTGDTIDTPVRGVSVRGMAMRDAAFADLKPSAGNESDYGTLGQWHRPGQTLRTPKVTLKTGHLWYLVRGAGHAYAVVDSHLIVGGPLHGALLHEWKNDGKADAWKWVNQDLTPYAGQRCHVEFTPSGTGPLQIARVIEASQPPAIDEPNAALASAVSDPSITSIEALSQGYQKLLIAAADRLSAGTIAGSADAHDQARIADWLIRRPALFGATPAALESGKQFVAAQSELAAKVVRQSPTAPAMWEGNGVDENLLIRGVAKNPGDPVPRRFLQAIAGTEQKAYPQNGSGRLQLAEAMLAESDPFVARVMVNRVWQHLFGGGIVPTVDNFGVLGQLPTHPELLDYLSDHFRTDQAWSIKKLIRSIMLSSTYQMSSKADPRAEQADPQNLLLHHMPIRRLESEAIRDAILSVSGRMDPRVGGAPVEVHLTDFMDGRGKPAGGPLDGDGRRSIYTRVRRNFLPPMMLAFDTPNPFACVGRRNVSNVPAQALILMNDPFVADQAALWAKHVLADAGKSPAQRITGMYQAALARDPRAAEVEAMLKFVDEQGEAYGVPRDKRESDPRVWADLCHVVFNMKEFVFIE